WTRATSSPCSRPATPGGACGATAASSRATGSARTPTATTCAGGACHDHPGLPVPVPVRRLPLLGGRGRHLLVALAPPLPAALRRRAPAHRRPAAPGGGLMRTLPAVAAVLLPLIAVAARRLVSGAARELSVSER